MRSERGQAAILLVGILLAVVIGGLFLGIYARAVGVRGDQQRAVDLAALAGARSMRDAYPRVLELGPGRLSRAQYEELGRRTAIETAARNRAPGAVVDFPRADGFAPVLIRVRVMGTAKLPAGRPARVTALAEAELVPDTASFGSAAPGAGEYRGPFAARQGKPMRPDVALAFDRMAAAARSDGISLIVVSAFRSDAEQARLFAAHPDPKWVARPGTSLHRLGTELDLGPAAAYGWLADNARRFGFTRRSSSEPWHYGLTANPGTASVGWRAHGDGDSGSAIPAWVPERYASAIARAAQRWRVGAALLAAQLRQESGFDAGARSPAGAQGIAQFMPATARSYGLADPFDAEAA